MCHVWLLLAHSSEPTDAMIIITSSGVCLRIFFPSLAFETILHENIKFCLLGTDISLYIGHRNITFCHISGIYSNKRIWIKLYKDVDSSCAQALYHSARKRKDLNASFTWSVGHYLAKLHVCSVCNTCECVHVRRYVKCTEASADPTLLICRWSLAQTRS